MFKGLGLVDIQIIQCAVFLSLPFVPQLVIPLYLQHNLDVELFFFLVLFRNIKHRFILVVPKSNNVHFETATASVPFCSVLLFKLGLLKNQVRVGNEVVFLVLEGGSLDFLYLVTL